ncbi:hypothetical protein [Rhodovarius lipocyclicus]|uniref:hypothetical protein n=1 Tax=Rhodovarius lipocyclicus TaxID=268410 RepID=UPI00135AC2FE|nr:hypothetical protein [Rhodovarius lipocyclicus]
MRSVILATALAAALSSGAGATGISVNNEQLQAGTTLGVCMARAAAAIGQAGIRPLNPTSSAAWGELDGGRIFTIYCIPQNNVAIIVGAGNRYEDVDAHVTTLRNAFRGGTSGGAPVK